MNITKILAFCLSLILIPQLALASSASDLKALLENYTYTMTVEWDQKDETFAQIQNESLSLEIQHLLQEGLTRAELKRQIELFSGADLSVLESEISGLDLNDAVAVKAFILHQASKNQKKGAAWAELASALSLSLLFTSALLLLTLELLKAPKDVK